MLDSLPDRPIRRPTVQFAARFVARPSSSPLSISLAASQHNLIAAQKSDPPLAKAVAIAIAAIIAAIIAAAIAAPTDRFAARPNPGLQPTESPPNRMTHFPTDYLLPNLGILHYG
jgi:hypothetical protein